MGWIAGGSFAVIDKLAAEIRAAGGQISLSAPVERIDIVDGRVAGIAVAGRSLPFETVVSTIPVQYLPRLAPGLPAADAAKLRALDNVGVVCAVAKLAQALSGNFWVNITDPRMDVPGVIEISNLRQDLGAHIVYVPFYLHKDNPKYAEPDAAFATKVRQYLRWINPALRPEDILDVAVFRYEYAQPVATPGFLGKLPPMGSPERRGFYFADTAYCYPEDRSIQESIRIARQLASLVVGGG
ncbi:MAG: FAD-dependent oxidoreductase, partial [Propionibacteriaceae bacterium]|jgi:protoporphyrinogen oxidase|nr:FAD-dependent oxidoreductase [Propionibacteriaceae bacterium]